MNGKDKARDLIRKGDCATSLDLEQDFHHLIVSPTNKPHLAFEAIGKVYQYRSMPFGTLHFPIFFAQALAMVLTKIWRESIKERLCDQSLTTMCILEAFWWTIAYEKCESEPKQQKKLFMMDFGLVKNEFKDGRPEKIRTSFPIMEIHQFNIEKSFDLNRISRINNRQTKFIKSPSKRSFLLLKVNGLSKDESTEEYRMEREQDSTKGNPSRTLLVAGRKSKELRDDFRSENYRGSDGIRRISEGLGSDSGTLNKELFCPTWRMDQRTKILDKHQKGDGSHKLRSILQRIILSRAADQNDAH
ncbi:MAG: hypothetical protein EZS28_005196 [Streblomastix strix]|uniref:Reverse transcriptase domain-containing protein n=1 Tax=Streblomastix strix TaxID=222440 RepID=A0A5J4WXI7_9EUKA|nr:MAG: hypothetical protein EZS28_005196 [Streblomastix strix]